MGGRPKQYDHELIIRLAKEHTPVTEIMRQVGCGWGTVVSVCRDRGVSLHRAHTLSGTKSFIILHQLLYTERSLVKIGEDNGISHQRVTQLLGAARNAGFEFPHRESRPVKPPVPTPPEDVCDYEPTPDEIEAAKLAIRAEKGDTWSAAG